MKKTLLAALAIAGFAVTTGAQAQQISYTPGDALLMFKATTGQGNDRNVYINLGNLTSVNFTRFNLDFSTVGNVLENTFGANWTRNTVYWGVIGGEGNTPSFTYATTRPVRSDLIADDLWMVANGVNQAFYAGTGVLASVGTITDSLGNSHGYSAFSSSASGAPSVQEEIGWGIFDVSTVINPSTEKRNLYYITVDGNYNVLSPVRTGTIEATGTTFKVVPEPSTYALIGLGALLLMVAYRRRSNA